MSDDDVRRNDQEAWEEKPSHVVHVEVKQANDNNHDASVALLEEHLEEERHEFPHPQQVQQLPPQPVNTPVAAEQPAPASSNKPNTPGVLILQWLTYAFWGWALIALYWLTALSVGFFIDKQTAGYENSYLYDSNDMLAYALAAVIVLFIISIICDAIYSRFEPRKKTGAATVIMIIHAVIFALCGIGSLITGVFAFVSTLVNGGGAGATTTMVAAGIMTVLYGATLLRTLHPAKIKRVTQLYWAVMIVSALVISSLGIIGPVAYAQNTKDDRLLESGLPDVAYAVNDYADRRSELPTSLDNLDFQDYQEDAAKIVEAGLVTYIPKEQLNDADTKRLSGNSYSVTDLSLGESKDPVFHYQLCVTYDDKKRGTSYGGASYNNDYEVTPDTNRHDAGKVCYDLQTDYIY